MDHVGGVAEILIRKPIFVVNKVLAHRANHLEQNCRVLAVLVLEGIGAGVDYFDLLVPPDHVVACPVSLLDCLLLNLVAHALEVKEPMGVTHPRLALKLETKEVKVKSTYGSAFFTRLYLMAW